MEQRSFTQSKMTEDQVRQIVESLGLEVQSETDTNLLVFCPFHSNTHSAALSVSKESGVFYCFGAGCNEKGNIITLIRRVSKCSYFAALRVIEKNEGVRLTVEEQVAKLKADEEIPVFPQKVIDKFQEDYWKYERPQQYMRTRKIERATAKHFNLTYDKSNDMICVPVYDKNGQPVGLVGRGIKEKVFKNSVNLPSSKTLYNYHNARRMSSESVIIVESSFDAMRVWQATDRAVVATLGGTFSDKHLSQIYRSFGTVILGTDGDEPGIKFARRIAKKCSNVGLFVRQARFSEQSLFPEGCKDFGDCTDSQIRHMIDNIEHYTGG